MAVETGNSWVINYGLNPCPNFNFMLRVEGLWDCPCKSVHVFQKENEYELIQEGGLNDYVHMRRKPISKPFTFQVERYVGVDAFVDPLANGTDLVLPLILLVNRYHMKASYAYPIRTYCFTGCTVMSKEYGELNAEKSGLLVETTTIAYREMFAVDMGYQGYNADPWHFKSTDLNKPNLSEADLEKLKQESKNDFKGVGASANTVANYGITEKRKTELKEDAAKNIWSFSNLETNRHNNKLTNTTPTKKADLQAKAVKWDIQSPTKNQRAKQVEEQKTKSQLEEMAVKWDINRPKVSKSAEQPKEQKGMKYLQAKAVKWSIKTPDKNRSAKQIANQKKKNQLEVRAVKWNIKEPKKNQSAKQIKEQKSKMELEAIAVKYNIKSPKKVVRAVQVAGAKTKAAMRLKAVRWNIKTPARKTSAITIENQLDKSQMESKATKWIFKSPTEGATKSPDKQMTKKEMIEKATKWNIKNPKKGSAKTPDKQLTKKAMEAKTIKWPTKKSAVQITEFLQRK